MGKSSIIVYEEMSLVWDADMLFEFHLTSKSEGVEVSINMEGFETSLENLKALLEGRDLPHM